MGKVVSSLGRRAIRPFTEFNLEQRVAKELGREKRPAAPRHQTTARLIKEAVKEQPKDVKRSLEEKDDMLLEHLRNVYVTSQDVMPQFRVSKDNPARPLPTDRTVVTEPEFGFMEPKNVPHGRVTLREAVEVITRHQEDPSLWTAQHLAHEYRLSVELTEKVLRHFRTFVMVVPAETEGKVAASTMSHIPLSAPHTIRQLQLDEGAPQDRDKDRKSG